MGMTARSALRYASGVADLDFEFLEQPLRDDDLVGMTALAGKSPVPLAGDECLGSLSDVLVYQRAGALSGVNLKTIKCGGIAETKRVADICDALGLSIKLACKVAESSVGAAALVHLGYTISNLDWGISISNIYLAEDVVATPLLPADGTIPLPRGPGLGIQIDEAAIARWRTE
jgi:muconate cycloisomerase